MADVGRRRWIFAGAVAAGVGVAMLGGAGQAHASTGREDSAATTSSSAQPAKPSRTAKTGGFRVQRASPATAQPARINGTAAESPRRITAPARVAPSAPSAAPAPGPLRAAALAAQAYLYGYPLLEFQRVRAAAPSLNTISSLTTFASPDVDPIWTAIGGGKRPNVDTFYSIAQLDLGNGPVVLSVPDMDERYFSFQLTDPYTNVVDYIGSRSTGPQGGSYAITWTGGPKIAVPGAQTVEVPYRNILMLGRTLAADAADQETAIALMSRYTLTAIGEPAGSPPTATQRVPGLAMLDAISAAMEDNPPPQQDSEQLAALARIGVGPGLRVADADLGPASRLAADLAVKATAALLPMLAGLTQLGSAVQHHGWATPDSAIGNFGTDYLLRAGVAELGLLANTPDEAMYSAALLDSGLLPLDGHSSYTLHFAPGQEPPAGAFWSVTVYDGNGMLVPNAQGRYSVSSSRPDELVRRPDGSIDIVFSRHDPADAGANWLAVPAGSFSVYLRIYVPDEAALDGTWTAPGIRRRCGGLYRA